MRAPLQLLAPLLAIVGLATASPAAEAGAKPATDAMDELNKGRSKYHVVQNRFFLNENRCLLYLSDAADDPSRWYLCSSLVRQITQ